jgi:FkbM family methyltransferase
MFPHLLARLTSYIPSPVKYRFKGLKPTCAKLMRWGGSVITIDTAAGTLGWEIDELTSQQFILGTYEPYMQEAFARFIKPGFTVYDVGAHAGYHSMFCGLLVGSGGRVIAFEPNSKSRESIERQMALNTHVSARVMPYAISDECRASYLDTTSGSSQGYVSDVGDLAIELRTIDSLVRDQLLPLPDLIKIDVEGHEEQVIRGALESIERNRPVILCDPNDGETASMVERLVAPLGYRLTATRPITLEP